jgi:hypothetical protein
MPSDLPRLAPKPSTITQSAVPNSSSSEDRPRLSEQVLERISRMILEPLLLNQSLADFFPIVKNCPLTLVEKEIICLHDLEKTLMFMAPERTPTSKLYLDFCLTSIHCIQATVNIISEREQVLPHDQLYAHDYFADLVDQITAYAQTLEHNQKPPGHS